MNFHIHRQIRLIIKTKSNDINSKDSIETKDIEF